MPADKPQPTTIAAYIAAFPQEIQIILEEMRAAIRRAAPEAQEKISYGMPAFALEGNLVYFAANKHHIGFYPTPSAIVHFHDELAAYEGSKGAVRFPLQQPIPYDLVGRITAWRVAENLARAEGKKKTRR